MLLAIDILLLGFLGDTPGLRIFDRQQNSKNFYNSLIVLQDQIQAQTLDKLYHLLSEHQQRTLAEFAPDSTLVVALTCEEAIRFVPPLASLEESSEIAATAQSPSAHLKSARVEVANWRSRFALRQAYPACHPENLAKALGLLGTPSLPRRSWFAYLSPPPTTD